MTGKLNISKHCTFQSQKMLHPYSLNIVIGQQSEIKKKGGGAENKIGRSIFINTPSQHQPLPPQLSKHVLPSCLELSVKGN